MQENNLALIDRVLYYTNEKKVLENAKIVFIDYKELEDFLFVSGTVLDNTVEIASVSTGEDCVDFYTLNLCIEFLISYIHLSECKTTKGYLNHLVTLEVPRSELTLSSKKIIADVTGFILNCKMDNDLNLICNIALNCNFYQTQKQILSIKNYTN